jgi:hypothetical protein
MARKVGKLSDADLLMLKSAKEGKIADINAALAKPIRSNEVRSGFELTVSMLQDEVRRIDAELEKREA